MALKKRNPVLWAGLLSVLLVAIAAIYFFRATPFVKVWGIRILGDRALKNTLEQFHTKFVPEQTVHYNTTVADSIQVSWAFRPEYALATYPIPVVGDVDHDGKPEVYVGSHSRYLYALDGKSGNTLWSWKLPFGVFGGRVVNLVDLDGDGREEIIAGTHTTLPIRVYALRTGISDNDRVLWYKNLSGDFFEGGLNTVFDSATHKNIIVAVTRDAPYSRGSVNLLNPDGSFLVAPEQGVDDCISRPAIGKLTANQGLSFVHGSHNYYQAKYGNHIVARDLTTGKILWISPYLGDGGYQNHQIADIDFDGNNEVIAFAQENKKNHIYLLNGKTGALIREQRWSLQGILREEKRLLVTEKDSTVCLSADGKRMYSIPVISFGTENETGTLLLFNITNKKDSLTVKVFRASDGVLVRTFQTILHIPASPLSSDTAGSGEHRSTLSFLTLADTDNNGEWDAIMQYGSFICNLRLPIKMKKGIDPLARIAFRNSDNAGVLYR